MQKQDTNYGGDHFFGQDAVFFLSCTALIKTFGWLKLRFGQIMKNLIWWFFILLGAARANAQEQQAKYPDSTTPLVVDSLRHEVRVLAVYHPGKFSGFLRFVPNYHLLVWDDGGAARESLFSTPVPDTALINALERVGAVAGNNLTMDAWDKRKDPQHPAPQTRIAGTPVEILVWWQDDARRQLLEPQPLAELLNDPGGRGLDFRFGGNRDLIHHWHSGCLVCLYSCPGSKVGNAAYTVRDYATGATQFTPRLERLPKSGGAVTIIFRVRK